MVWLQFNTNDMKKLQEPDNFMVRILEDVVSLLQIVSFFTYH